MRSVISKEGIRLPARDQGEFFGVFDAFQVQVYVEFRPVKVISVGILNVEQLFQRCFPKPWKIVKCEKILVSGHKQPEAMWRDIKHFNVRSAAASVRGFHFVFLQQLAVTRSLRSSRRKLGAGLRTGK